MKTSALESIRKVKKDKRKKGPPPTAKKVVEVELYISKFSSIKTFFICLVPVLLLGFPRSLSYIC